MVFSPQNVNSKAILSTVKSQSYRSSSKRHNSVPESDRKTNDFFFLKSCLYAPLKTDKIGQLSVRCACYIIQVGAFGALSRLRRDRASLASPGTPNNKHTSVPNSSPRKLSDRITSPDKNAARARGCRR